MADEFDRYLASALAPDDRLPDRAFVGQVQSRIMLEQRLAHERSGVLRNFAGQLIALVAVAAAGWWVARAEPSADWFAQSPGVCLSVVLIGFAFLLLLFTAGRTREAVSPR